MQDKDIGYLCDECARGRGWRWPKGHVATMHHGVCDVCKEKKSLSCWNDWLRGKEKVLTQWD